MFIWLGDSWQIGAELRKDSKREFSFDLRFPHQSLIHEDDTELAYPSLVSQHFNQDILVLAMGGGSMHFAAYALMQLLLNRTTFDEPTTVFVPDTGEMRRFGINLIGQTVHEGSDLANIRDRDPYQTYQDINREQFAIYDYTMALNNIYLTAEKLGIHLVRYHSWCVAEPMMDLLLIPEENHYHKEQFTLTSDLQSYTDDVYKTFMYPCAAHPNVVGHKAMANAMINLLDDNDNFRQTRKDLY